MGSYSSTEVQLVYSTAPLDWAKDTLDIEQNCWGGYKETWWKTIFGGWFVQVIFITVAILERLLVRKFFPSFLSNFYLNKSNFEFLYCFI